MQPSPSTTPEVLIIGGGLAGLVNAIHLSGAGRRVLLIEKHDYPRHKVCGEYISNEVLPYLRHLGVDPFAAGAVAISRLALSTVSGKLVEAPLPLGGFGISRYTLDHLLYQRALANGCTIVQDTVTDVTFAADTFTTTTRSGQTYTSPFVIGAFGKRSNLDARLGRKFMQRQAPYLGVKGHYTGDFPADLVALHNFQGGYCGVSLVEDQRINICYLADFKSFKQHKNLAAFQDAVLCQNPHLRDILTHATPLFDEPLTISQVSFLPKPTVEDHLLMSGDSAGMIHPLCGNGMGMAIHSALLLSESLLRFFAGDLPSRAALELEYRRKWQETFRKRLFAGRLFNTLFAQDRVFDRALTALTFFPQLLPPFIKQTHGKSLLVDEQEGGV